MLKSLHLKNSTLNPILTAVEWRRLTGIWNLHTKFHPNSICTSAIARNSPNFSLWITHLPHRSKKQQNFSSFWCVCVNFSARYFYRHIVRTIFPQFNASGHFIGLFLCFLFTLLFKREEKTCSKNPPTCEVFHTAAKNSSAATLWRNCGRIIAGLARPGRISTFSLSQGLQRCQGASLAVHHAPVMANFSRQNIAHFFASCWMAGMSSLESRAKLQNDALKNASLARFRVQEIFWHRLTRWSSVCDEFSRWMMLWKAPHSKLGKIIF